MERKEAIKYVKTHLLDEKYNIEALTTLIPELKEPDDKKIKKCIIDTLKGYHHLISTGGITKEDMIAWIEKQGESIDKEKVKIGAIKDLALSIINYLDNNRVEGCMNLSSMECEDIEDACINSKWTKLYNYMKKKLEKKDKRNSNYIHITQEIIDYINKHKAKFENDTPKLGDIWYVKEIHSRPGNPIVELENDKGAWMNLPLHVVDIIQNYSTSLSDTSSIGKSTDNVESKIVVGDWVVRRDMSDFYGGKKFAQITNVDDEELYWLDCRTWITGREIRLWTIHDAKDGDVLVSPRQEGCEVGEQIFIFKRIGNRDYVDNCIEYYCDVCDGEFYVNKICYMGTISSPLYPATEKQRDLLFAKMKKAGYKWDDEKKQILRIDNSKNTIEK